MKTIDAGKLQEALREFSRVREWDQFHSVKNLSTALVVEVAELAEIFQWRSEEDSNRAHENPMLKGKIAEELADVFGYLLIIADKCEIDLNSALESKIRINAEKYPVSLSRGNAKKYTDFD
jgi:NTP pyrophosphatase (non-canonical NTP hydrolase)